ncbi:MAG: hypothetical protein AAF431_08025 [Pseudomonadota bacterium]
MTYRKLILAATLLVCVFSTTARAAFPDDFSGVIWNDPNISGWSQTSNLTVSVGSRFTDFQHSKQAVWPNTVHSVVGRCCNASVWSFIKRNGQWYATTFEYLRPNTPRKFTSAFDGLHLKRRPFLDGSFNWRPANGEVYGFMVSGFARFNLNDVNAAERSNVFFYKWGEGPTNAEAAKNFTEVARNGNGTPNYNSTPVVEEPEEQCENPIPPEPTVNTHRYTGPATGTVVLTGATNQTLNFSDQVTIDVNDDRSMTFTVDGDSFNSTVAQNGTFSGTYTYDILGQCEVDIVVNGVINGTSASGTTSGSETCLITGLSVTATFNASFNASSATAPSYLDQRPPVVTPTPCNAKLAVPAISILLMEDD